MKFFKNPNNRFMTLICGGAVLITALGIYVKRVYQTSKYSLKGQEAYFQMQDSLSQRYDNLWDKITIPYKEDDGIFSPEEQIMLGRKLGLINDSTKVLEKPYVLDLNPEELQKKVNQLEATVQSFEAEQKN